MGATARLVRVSGSSRAGSASAHAASISPIPACGNAANSRVYRAKAEVRPPPCLVSTALEWMNGDDNGVPSKKRKLLGFTDNRQDAALQAGHFNDFLFVSLLRGLFFVLSSMPATTE